MRTHRVSAALGAFVLLGALASGATPALAADPDPILHYTGTLIGGDGNPYPLEATVDCSTGSCFVSTTVTDQGDTASLNGASPVQIVDGSASVDVSDSGDPCSDTFLPGGRFEVTVTGTTMSGNRFVSGRNGICDGVADTYPAYSLPFDAVLDSGDTCFLSGTCAIPVPSSTAVIGGVGPSNDSPIEPATPSTFSTLATVLDSARPINALWATALSVVLVILIALPTHLLNSAVEGGTDRLSAWWRTRRPKAPPPADLIPRAKRAWAGWPLAAAGVLAASLISSFADPSFGLNLASPRVFGSILASFLLDAVLGWFLVIWLVRRTNRDAVPTFTFAPATLLIVVAAVVFSRVTGFQPGIVFGLVAGVSFGAVLAAQRVRVTLIGLAYGFGTAIVGWVGYSLLATSGAEGFAAVFVQETLSAVAIGGIAALPIALIPLRGLAGYEVFAWNRVVWAIAYAIGLFGFFFVLMPMPFAWTGVPLSAGVWITLYVGYAVLSVGTWLLIVRPWRKAEAETKVEI